MSMPIRFGRRPKNLNIQGEMPSSNPVWTEFGISIEPGLDIINIFKDIRQLMALTSIGSSIMLSELTSLEGLGAGIMHVLLSLKIRKPKQQMQDLDYLNEACRLAALMFVKRTLHGVWPRCPIITRTRCQLKELLLEKESRPLSEVLPLPHLDPEYYTWALFMGGIHSLEDEDKSFFAKRIAVLTQSWLATFFGQWPGVMSCIKNIAWHNTLDGPVCEAFGARVVKCIRSIEDIRNHALEKFA